jgi:hypothetical protein
MIDRFLGPLVEGPLNTLTTKIIDSNVSGGQLSFFTFVVGVTALLMVGFGAYPVGLALILLNRLLHDVARRVANETGATDFTCYFARGADVFVLAGFVFFFAMSQPHQAMAAGLLLFAYAALSVSVLPDNDAVRALPRPIYHFGSLVGHSETILFMILVCLYPVAFSAIAVLFSTLCFVTVIGRLWDAAKTLR